MKSFWLRLLFVIAVAALTDIVMVFVLDKFGGARGGLIRTAIGGGVTGLVCVYLGRMMRNKDGTWRRASDS